MPVPIQINITPALPDPGGPSAGFEILVNSGKTFQWGGGFRYLTTFSFAATDATNPYAYRGAYDTLLASGRVNWGIFHIQADLGYAIWDPMAWTGSQFHHGLFPNPVAWNGFAFGGGVGLHFDLGSRFGLEVFARSLAVLPVGIGVPLNLGLQTGVAGTVSF